jgi:cytochrome d ubiquinol oxidase subunit I
MGPTGFVAVLAGWVTTEVGRQPFTVYGHLRTAESLAPVEAPAVAASLTAFVIVYFALFGAGTYYILKMMAKHPGELAPLPGTMTRTAGITQAASLTPKATTSGVADSET